MLLFSIDCCESVICHALWNFYLFNTYANVLFLFTVSELNNLIKSMASPNVFFYLILALIPVLICIIAFLLLLFRRNQLNLSKIKESEQIIQTTKSNLDNSKQHLIISNCIIACANQTIGNNRYAFDYSMQRLATELRNIFKSEYCAIGTFDGIIAKDRVIDFNFDELSKSNERILYLEEIQSAHISNKDCMVYIALKDFKSKILSYQGDGINKKSDHLNCYKGILKSGDVINTTIIPIRESRNNYGYIQFINSDRPIKYKEFAPFMKAFIGLCQLIINRDQNEQERVKKQIELIKAENRAKDTAFYSDIQAKKENINELLDAIMKYFSQEFNAAVISFRIPIINDNSGYSLFYLRCCYIHPNVNDRKGLINHYYLKRMTRNNSELGGYSALRCKYIHEDNKEIISCATGDTDYYKEHDLNLYEDTFIMPIFRDNDQTECNCLKKESCCGISEICIEKIKDYYGIFRLRISKVRLDDKSLEHHYDDTDVKTRLSYLSNQIALLFNTIVDKQETKSLEEFQNELKNSSFVKIQEFDNRCVNIIKNSVGALVCSIYRYDPSAKQLMISATTTETIHFNETGDNLDVKKNSNKCIIPIPSNRNILAQAFQNKRPIYIYDIRDPRIHQSSFIENSTGSNNSAMAVPLISKEKKCLGVVLLLGKNNPNRFISTSYWEHDIGHIEFIVNTLTRISESDNERLTFLSQLSHELLSPISELVYDNDLLITLAKRDPNCLTKQQLISTIQDNIDKCMLLKYIISDTEFRYASSGRNMDYNIVKQERPQGILLDAIRLLEKEAHGKGLTIKTRISNMPPIFFDEGRMMQVFINLLTNAIRYSNDFTSIDVFYKLNNGFHEIVFANDGIGVQEEEKDAIFELFFRGENAKIKSDRGSGIGLYLVRDIMRAHGGDCFVRGLKDPTEFVITIPNKQ